MHRSLPIALALAALAACSSPETHANSALGARHPADPGSPEAPAYARSSALDGALAQPTVAPAHEAANPAEGARVLTCPMHPDIETTTPGSCPLCGMQLVPKAEQP